MLIRKRLRRASPNIRILLPDIILHLKPCTIFQVMHLQTDFSAIQTNVSNVNSASPQGSHTSCLIASLSFGGKLLICSGLRARTCINIS